MPSGSRARPTPQRPRSPPLTARTSLAVLPQEARGTLAGVGVVLSLAGPPVQAGLGVAGGRYRCKAKQRPQLCPPPHLPRLRGRPRAHPSRLPPSAKPVPRLQTLTVVGAVVGVAHAQVAPTILHAVAAVWALRVHVARRGGHLCQRTARQPPSDALQQDGQPAASTSQPRTGPMALWSMVRREGLRPPVPHGKGHSACRVSFGAPACRARASFYRPRLGKGTTQGRARDGESISSPRGA